MCLSCDQLTTPVGTTVITECDDILNFGVTKGCKYIRTYVRTLSDHTDGRTQLLQVYDGNKMCTKE